MPGANVLRNQPRTISVAQKSQISVFIQIRAFKRIFQNLLKARSDWLLSRAPLELLIIFEPPFQLWKKGSGIVFSDTICQKCFFLSLPADSNNNNISSSSMNANNHFSISLQWCRQDKPPRNDSLSRGMLVFYKLTFERDYAAFNAAIDHHKLRPPPLKFSAAGSWF